MRPTVLALSIILSLFAWNSAAASTLLSQPIQNQQALLYYGGQTNQVNFDQGVVLGTVTTLRLWLQSTTTRTVYLGWQSANGNAGNNATATVSGGNVWQWVDFDLTWDSSYNAPIATSTRIFSTTTAQFLYYIPSYQGAPDVLAGCMQATSSLVYFMGGFFAPQCGTPTFELLGVSTSSPLATTSVPCVTECYSNVLFLPGIKGSRLYRPDYTGGTDQLWEPTSDADIIDLHLSAFDGSSVRDDVYVKQHDILDAAFGIAPAYYGAFINDMDAIKSHQIINDWEAVPYDWRLSVNKIVNNGAEINGRIYYDGALSATTSPYIIQEIRRLAANSKTGKVTIIAHSNGGLVTKALIKKLQDEHDPILEKIDKIIFVAVPQLGTPHSLGVLLHGYNEGLPSFIPEWAPDALHVLLTEHAARTFAENAPVAYNLLPSLKYFQDVSDPRFPVVRFDSTTLYQQEQSHYGNTIDNASEMNDFLLAHDGGVQSSSAA
jgi:pimeloyl-ACP methyl ester carboxylesterase